MLLGVTPLMSLSARSFLGWYLWDIMWLIAHRLVKREHSCFRVITHMFGLNYVRGATRLFRARDKFELTCLHLPAT